MTSTAAELIAKARRYDANTRAATGRTVTLYGELADALELATVRDDWEWGVEYGFDPRVVEPMRDRDSAERFMANKPLWANPGHFIRNEVVRRHPAGLWQPVGGTE